MREHNKPFFCLDNYVQMFGLQQPFINLGRILECYAGASQVNNEITALSGNIISVDPLFTHRYEDIEERVLNQCRKLPATQHDLAKRFLDDFKHGFRAGRYRGESLPFLPFADNTFDLALCPHWSFLDQGIFDTTFQIAAFLELCRVASVVKLHTMSIADVAKTRAYLQWLNVLRAEGILISQIASASQRGHAEGIITLSDTQWQATPTNTLTVIG